MGWPRSTTRLHQRKRGPGGRRRVQRQLAHAQQRQQRPGQHRLHPGWRVHNDFGGAVTLNNTSSVAGNQAPQGGGILNQSGTITLNNSSRIHDNEAAGDGGGIDNDAVVTLNDSSSIDHNTAGGNGGGIFNQGTVTRGPGSSIADNDPDDCVDDGSGTGCV